MSRRLLFVVNDSAFFVSHRLPMAIAAKQAGYDVTVATAASKRVNEIIESGLNYTAIPVKRGSQNVLTEIRLILALAALFRTLKPDIVHLVTIKPVLYGGILARLFRVKGVVSAISGMGYLFTKERGGLVRGFVEGLYRFALGHPNGKVIVQNESDRNMLRTLHALPDGHDVLIPGSGVDLNRFIPSALNNQESIIVLPARMLWDKGVGEFVMAARILRQRGAAARFVMVGGLDADNPAAITRQQLQAWQEEGIVEWWGYQEDMPKIFAMANLVVLPSYREGLPKALVEAAAAGRAIVTTDAPGCRDVVVDGVNGLLVPVGNSEALATAIQELFADRNRLEQMGNASRKIAEEQFDLNKIIDSHLSIYTSLIGDPV